MSRFSKRTRKVLVAFAAVGALAGPAIVIPQLAIADFSTITATTALNVRVQPNTSARVLGVLATGEQVERRGDPQGEWTPIRYRGQDGWVFSAFTSFGSNTSAAGGTATATDTVNVRSGASTLTPTLGTLAVGEKVAITGSMKGGWLPITYRGRAGFVYGAYVSFDSTTTKPPVTSPSAGNPSAGNAKATTDVNVRAGANTGSRVLGVLSPGQAVETRGAAQGEWTPVSYDGQDAWVFSAYLTTGGTPAAPPKPTTPAAPPKPAVTTGSASATTYVNVRASANTSSRVLGVLRTGQAVTTVIYDGQSAWVFTRYLDNGTGSAAPKTSKAYTTTGVNLRTGPGLGYRVVRILGTNTEVQVTGLTQNGFSQVLDDGQQRWISSGYLSTSPVTITPTPGPVQGPPKPPGGSVVSLNTGGSVGLDQLRPSAKQIVYSVRQNYPQITVMYGYRPDPLPDHPSGRAVDIMMPAGVNDKWLGDQVAQYLQNNANAFNIEYLIWRQRIWINGQSGWTWMADRGGVTANHMDHVHVTVRS